MKLLGHYEEVSVRGSSRRARVFVPTLLRHILISLAIALVPAALPLSRRPAPEKLREELLDPWLLGFFLLTLLIALLVFWGNRMFARDTRRMLAGELVARTGVLWAIGQENPDGRYPGPCRLAIETQDAAGVPLRNELYPLPEALYKRHMEKRVSNRRGCAWLVELAVLPPEQGPEFTEPVPSSGEPAPRDPMAFGEMPVFRGEVAEVFYLQRQPYGCSINDQAMFPKG